MVPIYHLPQVKLASQAGLIRTTGARLKVCALVDLPPLNFPPLNVECSASNER